jgi:hypothetical protein
MMKLRQAFKKTPLSDATEMPLRESGADGISEQLINGIKSSQKHALQIDELAEGSGLTQLTSFVRHGIVQTFMAI